jgi:hypothetical protein
MLWVWYPQTGLRISSRMTSAPVATGPVRVGDRAGQSPCLGGRGDVEDLVDQCRNPEGYGEKQHHVHERTATPRG